MKILILMSTLALFMIRAAVSFAIQFDIWEVGMSIQEVVGLARKHNIPISGEGLIPGSKKFQILYKGRIVIKISGYETAEYIEP